MKKLYFILIGFLVFSGVEAQIINFPDANLKQNLLSATTSNYIAFDSNGVQMKIDVNNNHEIEVSEAVLVFQLKLDHCSISSIVGISSFTSLQYINLNTNLLTSFDSALFPQSIKTINITSNSLISNPQIFLNNLPNLEDFEAPATNISSIIFNNVTNLKTLFLQDNPSLSTIDLSTLSLLEVLSVQFDNFSVLNISNLHLKSLDCRSNHITSLDISSSPNLESLSYDHNHISPPIDFSPLHNLKYLGCVDTNTTVLNISNTANINQLFCDYNNISIIDVSNCTNMNYLTCSNNPNLTTIYLKNGKLETFEFGGTPNLQYICADSGQISSIQTSINTQAYATNPSCVVNSYCTFIPGGTVYYVQGNVKYDSTNNGCDGSDVICPSLKLSSDNYGYISNYFTNNLGGYVYPIATVGPYTESLVLEYPTYFNVSPTSYNVVFPTTTSPFSQDFCISANGIHNDLEVFVLPFNWARPSFDAHYQIVYKNKGTHTQSGSVNLAFNDAVLDYVLATPTIDVQTLNNLRWNFSNLAPFETRVIDVVLNLNSPVEIPPLNSGDILNYTATVTGLADETPTDNSATLNQTIVNALDPNYKTCTEGTTVTPSTVGKYVHYMIGFENTGTANAQNIVVKDMIDTTKYDITTLVPIKGSAPFTTRITNTNQVEFIFQNINLPYTTGSNDGYVAFKIKTKSTLVLGNTFSNTANIYFDYNAPIVTNTATTTIAALANDTFVFNDYFILSPVPTKDTLNITTKQDIIVTSVSIYNTLGQLILVTSNPNTTIDVSNLATGSYFIKVITDKGTSSAKFMKE